VIAAVQVLLQMPKPDWKSALFMLGDPRFLSTLTSIDKDNIPEKVVTRPILNDFPNYVGTIGI